MSDRSAVLARLATWRPRCCAAPLRSSLRRTSTGPTSRMARPLTSLHSACCLTSCSLAARRLRAVRPNGASAPRPALPFPRHLSAAARAFVVRCLQPVPGERADAAGLENDPWMAGVPKCERGHAAACQGCATQSLGSIGSAPVLTEQASMASGSALGRSISDNVPEAAGGSLLKRSGAASSEAMERIEEASSALLIMRREAAGREAVERVEEASRVLLTRSGAASSGAMERIEEASSESSKC
mmetsp:Transcript_33826/g.100722  ORF Transcript_33826/g.100722 Transcript_33826/m.100722 type:complete len:243 (-) Transcript_33826:231-959(-)